MTHTCSSHLPLGAHLSTYTTYLHAPRFALTVPKTVTSTVRGSSHSDSMSEHDSNCDSNCYCCCRKWIRSWRGTTRAALPLNGVLGRALPSMQPYRRSWLVSMLRLRTRTKPSGTHLLLLILLLLLNPVVAALLFSTLRRNANMLKLRVLTRSSGAGTSRGGVTCSHPPHNTIHSQPLLDVHAIHSSSCSSSLSSSSSSASSCLLAVVYWYIFCGKACCCIDYCQQSEQNVLAISPSSSVSSSFASLPSNSPLCLVNLCGKDSWQCQW